MFCREPELVKRIGEATALEVRATGIPYVFAPCIAVIKENTFCIFSLDGNYVFY
jgi:beta-glucosidase-like glycosyl hydrolase